MQNMFLLCKILRVSKYKNMQNCILNHYEDKRIE
jgi:hypothetical protein